MHEELLLRYHCNDELLLTKRLELFGFHLQDINNLKNNLNLLLMQKEKFISDKTNIIDKLPKELLVLSELLGFDNNTEYIYVYSFKGFPDIIFRDLILEKLQEIGYHTKVNDVLELSKKDFIDIIDEILLKFSIDKKDYAYSMELIKIKEKLYNIL